MEDNVLYTVNKMQDTVPIEILVRKKTIIGNLTTPEATKTMKTSMGVARNSPVLSTDELRNENGEICFVTTKTFEEIVPIIVDGKANSIQEALNLPEALVRMHIYVIAENSFKLRPVYLFLSDHNYNGLAKIDIFDDFAETISVSFFVFSLSALVLLIMTTVNIILSFRSFYRVQQKDMAF